MYKFIILLKKSSTAVLATKCEQMNEENNLIVLRAHPLEGEFEFDAFVSGDSVPHYHTAAIKVSHGKYLLLLQKLCQ